MAYSKIFVKKISQMVTNRAKEKMKLTPDQIAIAVAEERAHNQRTRPEKFARGGYRGSNKEKTKSTSTVEYNRNFDFKLR